MIKRESGALSCKFRAFGLLFLLLDLLGAPAAVMASDINSAQWYGNIVISNNSSSNQSNASVVFTANTAAMISAGFLNSSANNSAVRNQAGSDIAFMPGTGSNPWCVWAGDMTAYQTVTETLYTGNVTGGKLSYFPAASGMEVSDNASLELGDNFTISYDAYIETTAGASKYIINKSDALSVYVSDNVSGNITASIWGGWQSPTGGSGSNWSNVSNAYDGGTGTYASDTYNTAVVGWGSFVTFTGLSISGNSVRYYPGSGAPVDQIDIDVYKDGGWVDVYEGSFTATSWNTKTFTAGTVTQARVRYHFTSWPYTMYFYELGVGANSGSTTTCSITGVPSGEYTLLAYADGINLYLDIPSTAYTNSVALSGASVPDNNNNWQIGNSSTTPYIESVSFTVGSTLKGSWQWEYGTLFYDQSGNGNTAIPTFRTTSSGADVSASLASILPVTEAKASVSTVAGSEPWSGAPPKPPGLTTPTGDISLFFAPMINAIITDTPTRILFWYWSAFAVISLGGLLAIRFGKSIVLKAFVMGALILGGALSNVYGLWTLIVFSCYAFGIIILSRHYGFG